MRIGIDASRASRTQHTGTEAYSWHLIRALIQSRRNHRITLYSPTELPESLGAGALGSVADFKSAANAEDPGGDRYTSRVIPFPRLWTHLRLNWELRRHPPDLLFVPSHVLPLGCPVPAVVTVHDLGYLYYPEAHRWFDRWYLDSTTRRHARSATCLIADSKATRADLMRHYGAAGDRIRVIYPGRDETLQRVEDPAATAAVRAHYGISGEYLLYLGTLQPRKNLVRLMDAYVRAQSAAAQVDPGDRPGQRNPQLVLAGKKGWLCDDLLRHTGGLGLKGQVVLPGYVATEHKAALLSGALALVFPSLYEGFGMPVLEAMACGVPVLTSNVSSLPEVAGDAALMVDPLSVDDIAAAITRLMGSHDLRRSLIERGYQQAQRFSWQRAAAQLWEVFDSFAP